MAPELVLALAGGLLVAVGLGWRYRTRARRRAMVQEALWDDDSERRLAALQVVTRQGLRPHADLLTAWIREESEPRLLDALAELVSRHSWEPVDRPEVLELRVWAVQRLDDRAPAGVPPAAGLSGRSSDEPSAPPEQTRSDGTGGARRVHLRLRNADETLHEIEVGGPE